MIKQKLAYSLLAAALLSGCSLIPDYERPSTDTPAGWTESDAAAPTKIAQDWWKNFNSAELDTLMAEALAQNNDLNAALARVEQARGLARASGAQLLPSVEGTGSLGYQRDNPSEGKTTSGAAGSAGLKIAYELDLFGMNRAEIAAAEADVDASGFASDATALIVMGDVAKGYFNVLNLEERLKISDQNLESSRELLRIVQARFDAGATTQLDVSQQKADLSINEANRATIEEQLKYARSTLAVLTGKAPQSLQVAGKTLSPLSIPEIAPGQPSKLVERRPDIRASEAALLGADADIGAARAAFFPTLTLGVDLTASASPLSDPASTVISVGSSLLAPIFKGGLLEGNLQYSKARKVELVETYRKTVLTSFKEVEDALASVKAAQQREQSLQNALAESRKAYDLSKQQYDVGSIDFQTLLDTRQTMLTAEDSYVQTRNQRLAAAVDLYKSLGGGWADATPATAAAAPAAPLPASTPVAPITTPPVTEPIAPATTPETL